MKEYNEPTIKIINFARENVVTDSIVRQALPEELSSYTSGSEEKINLSAYIVEWD